MRAPFPALFLLLAAQAGAQSFVSMGRLFTTPAERAQLDAQRSQGPQASAGATGGAVQGAPPLVPGAVAGAPGMEAAAACPPGAAAGCQPGAAAGNADAAAAQEPAPDPGLRLDGIVRRSNGRTMVIVNGEVQPAPAGGVKRGAVTLQSDGRPVVLKPGQRYDPATGVTHEAER